MNTDEHGLRKEKELPRGRPVRYIREFEDALDLEKLGIVRAKG